MKELRRKIIHQCIRVVDEEGIAIGQPRKCRSELRIMCILKHVVEFEGERLPLLLLLFLSQELYIV